MQHARHGCIGWTLVGLMALTIGCKGEPEKGSLAGKGKAPATAAGDKAGAVKPRVETPPPKPEIPRVALSNELLATCLVKVGDRMPEGELTDLEGKKQPIGSLYGKKLTVVFFWTAENPYSVGEVDDLNADVARPWADKGVKVVGIDLGDKPAQVRDAIKDLGLAYPVLRDPEKQYYAKVAKEKVLRTYLLDAQAKILWFDVEYSLSTRRDLLQAVEVALSKAG